MTSFWPVSAKSADETTTNDESAADGTVDGEFTVAAPGALPAHVEEFLALKASSAF